MRGFLRLGSTFLIAGAALLAIVDAEVAYRTSAFLLLAFGIPVVALWLAAGYLMAWSLVSEGYWDEERLYLVFAFETHTVSWSDVRGVRVLTPEGWPTRGASALVLLRYKHRVKGRQKRSWALLAMGQDQAPSPLRGQS